MKYETTIYAAVGILWAALSVIFFTNLYVESRPKPLPTFKTPGSFTPDPSKDSPVVRLHDLRTGRFFCSGTVISEHLIVTAAHCIQEYVKNEVVVSVKTSQNVNVNVSASVAGSNQQADYALLYGNFDKFNVMKISTDVPSILAAFYGPGARLIACGFPYAGPLVCSPVVSAAPFFFGIQSEGFLYPGMSGGPVIDLMTGNLVACNQASTENHIILSPLINLFDSLNIKVDTNR